MDAPETTSEAREIARANLAIQAARIGAILFALCLVYVLSLGPAVAIFVWAGGQAAHPTAAHAAKTFYAPLEYMSDHTPLEEPFNRYVEWWRHLGERLR